MALIFFSSLMFQGSISSGSTFQDLPVQQVSGMYKDWSPVAQVSVNTFKVFTQESQRREQAGLEHGTNICCPIHRQGMPDRRYHCRKICLRCELERDGGSYLMDDPALASQYPVGSQPLQMCSGEAVELDKSSHFLDLEEMRSHVLLGVLTMCLLGTVQPKAIFTIFNSLKVPNNIYQSYPSILSPSNGLQWPTLHLSPSFVSFIYSCY